MVDTDREIGAEVANDGAPGSEAASGAAEQKELDIGRQKEEALREALLKKRDCSERGEAECPRSGTAGPGGAGQLAGGSAVTPRARARSTQRPL